MSSLTVRDMIGLSVGKAFASAASNSGLNWSSTARNVSNAFRISMRRSCTVWHALSSVKTRGLEKRLAMFVMRRFAVVRRTSTVCNRSDMVAVCTSQRAVAPLMVKIRDRSTVLVQITSGHQLLRPLSNNTKASNQCVNCLIFIHTVTTALSDCLSEPLHMAVI